MSRITAGMSGGANRLVPWLAQASRRAQQGAQMLQRTGDEDQPAEALKELTKWDSTFPRLGLEPLDGPHGARF